MNYHVKEEAMQFNFGSDSRLFATQPGMVSSGYKIVEYNRSPTKEIPDQGERKSILEQTVLDKVSDGFSRLFLKGLKKIEKEKMMIKRDHGVIAEEQWHFSVYDDSIILNHMRSVSGSSSLNKEYSRLSHILNRNALSIRCRYDRLHNINSGYIQEIIRYAREYEKKAKKYRFRMLKMMQQPNSFSNSGTDTRPSPWNTLEEVKVEPKSSPFWKGTKNYTLQSFEQDVHEFEPRIFSLTEPPDNGPNKNLKAVKYEIISDSEESKPQRPLSIKPVEEKAVQARAVKDISISSSIHIFRNSSFSSLQGHCWKIRRHFRYMQKRSPIWAVEVLCKIFIYFMRRFGVSREQLFDLVCIQENQSLCLGTLVTILNNFEF
jgi:hypothetical protein